MPSPAIHATQYAAVSHGALLSQPRTQPATRKLLVHECAGAGAVLVSATPGTESMLQPLNLDGQAPIPRFRLLIAARTRKHTSLRTR
jgi:hypothetical protein